MNEARRALAELAGIGKTERVVRRSAAQMADYLDELLKQEGDVIVVPRMIVVGMKSVLRSVSKHVGASRG